MTERKLRVFLCHSSQNKPVVRELYQRLLAEGWIDPWLDEEKLLPGQDWDMEIEKAVEAADAVIVCLSTNSVTKEGYVQRELKYVLDIALEKPEGALFIVPLRLDECLVPRRLRTWHYADYFPLVNKGKVYNRILDSLRLRSGNENLTKLSENNSKSVSASDKAKMEAMLDDQLTPREKELLKLTRQKPKLSVGEMATYLGVANSTVRSIYAKIIEKSRRLKE